MNALQKHIGPHSFAGATIVNILTVYAAYSLCRLLFLLTNWSLYADHLTAGYALSLFGAGLIFDTTAILYSNVIIILMYLLPLHPKETTAYYKTSRWIYTIVNSICLWSNLCDCAYFPFTGKRTTMSVIDEFAHEGIGGFAKIMLNESVGYWYLFIIGIAISWMLYRAFRMPDTDNIKPLWAYYPAQCAALSVAIALTIIGMRGGATSATRPITISNANQYINQPVDAGIVLNTPFSMMRTLSKKPMKVPNYMTDEEAALLYSPMHTASDTSAFRPMNVVVLIVESFGKQHIGSLNKEIQNGQWHGFTPELDSILAQSLTFRYSFANGRKSIDGMPSVLSSIPSFVEPFFLTPASLNKLSGVAGELTRKKGYRSAFFHGAMNGSMGFEAFAKSTGFQSYYGRTEYNADSRYNGDDDFDGTWAIWDEEFLQFYADKMSELEQPFVTGVFTATSHPPFAIPDRYTRTYTHEGSIAHLADGSTVSNPLFRALRYTDHALGEFFRKAAKQPWYNNTIFVLSADHTSGNELPEYNTSLGLYSIPIAFFVPSMPEIRGYDTTHIVNQIDIMPSVLDLMHYDRDFVAFGQSVFSTPAEQTFAINYIPASGIYQFISGEWLIQSDGPSITGAYLYRTDTMLTNNLTDHSEYTDELNALHKCMQSVVQQYMQRMTRDQLTAE